MHFSDEQKDGLAIAITEIVNNAITHGNRNDLRRKVIIDYELTSDAMIITIQDEGRGFAPEKVADPLAPENLLKESGRGIFIVRTLMDSVNYEFNESGTLVRMVKQKHQE